MASLSPTSTTCGEDDEDDIGIDAHSDKDEDDDDLVIPRSPTGSEIRGDCATECVNHLFSFAKLRLTCPPRWAKLFLRAATRYEKELIHIRDSLYISSSLDDAAWVARLQGRTPPLLWSWWAYDLGLVERASKRCRPELLKVLPELYGTAYPGYEAVASIRAALDFKHPTGSSQAILDRQRGESLISIVRLAFERKEKIDVAALKEELNHPLAGPWVTTPVPAVGVNHFFAHGDYAGWRPLHFVAAATKAEDTAADTARLLFDAKADTTVADASGATALHIAALRSHTQIVDLLLEFGAPIEHVDHFGCTPLLSAARAKNVDVVRNITAWVMPPGACREILQTAAERRFQQFNFASGVELLSAVGNGDFKKVQRLATVPDALEKTADVNIRDSSGRNAAHLATTSISDDQRCADMMRVLVRLSTDINAVDSQGETPLHIAARLGRAPVIRTLIRLRAHPSLPDFTGRTPLMCTISTSRRSGEPPAYDGVLLHPAVRWTVVADILDWNGRGEPPGPPTRRVAPEIVESIKLLLDDNPYRLLHKFKSKTSNTARMGEEYGENEAEDDEEESGTHPTESDAVLARADALCSLGFDDQKILDSTGRANRCDKLQLHRALFQRERGGPDAELRPNVKRLRLLWKALIGPLLRMQQGGALQARPAELLHYLLSILLGSRGPAFAALVTMGFQGDPLPSWGDFEDALRKAKGSLDRRANAVSAVGFRGARPFRQLWVGSVWDYDAYPREPDSAPWAAFEYVDRETATVLDKKLLPKKPAISKEAFKDNLLPFFETLADGSVATGTVPPPYRGDRLQLANRLFVDEALGQCALVEERLQLIGEKLLCPLLEVAIAALGGSKQAEQQAATHRDLLRYLASQMNPPKGQTYAMRRPYGDAWEAVRRKAVAMLLVPPSKALASLSFTPSPEALDQLVMWHRNDHCLTAPRSPSEITQKKKKSSSKQKQLRRAVHKGRGDAAPDAIVASIARQPPTQAALIPLEHRRWLVKRFSSRAFYELRKCDAVQSTEDFNAVVCQLAAESPQAFEARFWHAAFGLFLWGRAMRVRDLLGHEVVRKLPADLLRGGADSIKLVGPRLRPRADVLAEGRAVAAATIPNRPGAGTPPLGGRRASSPKDRPLTPQAMQRLILDKGISAVPHFGKQPESSEREEAIGSEPLAEPGALPGGFDDLLHMEVVCSSEAALQAAFTALCDQQASYARNSRTSTTTATRTTGTRTTTSSGGESNIHVMPHYPQIEQLIGGSVESTSLTVTKATNGFHPDMRYKVLPRTAGVLLQMCLSVYPHSRYGTPLQHNVQVELLLEKTLEARWLADCVGATAAEDRPRTPEIVEVPIVYGGRGQRKRPVHNVGTL